MQGILASVAAILLFNITNVISRYYAVNFDADPTVFTCVRLIGTAFILILFAGPGHLVTSTLKVPHTWIFGASAVLINITIMYGLTFMTATDFSAIYRLDMIFGMIIGALFFRRYLQWKDSLGALLVISGACLILSMQEAAIRPLSILVLGIAIFFSVVMVFMTETHPVWKKAKDSWRDRARVVGWVIFVTSIMVLLMIIAGSFLRDTLLNHGQTLPGIFEVLPSNGALQDKKLILIAFLLGATIGGPMFILYFLAGSKAKSEVYMMVASIGPIFNYAIEKCFSIMGLLEIRELSLTDSIAFSLIVFGSIFLILNRQNLNRKRISSE